MKTYLLFEDVFFKTNKKLILLKWIKKSILSLVRTAFILSVFFFTNPNVSAQINSGGSSSTADHQKQIIGYFTQWDAWKGTNNGLPSQGVMNQLNIDYSQYTILNFSFFGVANDGSLHSGDLRNKNIYKAGEVQAPGDLFHPDVYSSWDYWLLYGELELIHDLQEGSPAWEAGYRAQGTRWNNINTGLSGSFPIPFPKEGGAPGLLKLCQDNGVKVMASIGGWSMCKHFPEMARDAVKKQKFIEDCQKLIALGFDGIDLDWEYPGSVGMNIENFGPDDYDNFLELVKDIRTAIGPDKLITSAFSASPSKLNGFNWSELNQYMDYYNMMSYDFEGGWSNNAGHNSALYGSGLSWDVTYQYLNSQGVPSSKINMGVGFYGRGVITDGAASLGAATVKRSETVQPDGPITTAADFTNWPKEVWDGTPTYQAIKEEMNNGWTKHWDDNAKVPYLTKNNFFLSYDDEESIGHKAKYVTDNGIGGVIVWQVYGDLDFGPITATYGGKLRYCPQTKSPLVNKLNDVFAQNTSGLALNITSPSNGAIIEQSTLTSISLQATATITTGSIQSVTFSVDNQTLNGSASGNNYSASWTPSSYGNYVITVTATDNTNASLSQQVSVTVSCIGASCPNENPNVSITSPTNNQAIEQENLSALNLIATATDNDGTIASVVFSVDGQTLNGSASGDNYSASWTPSSFGSYVVIATATDNDGGTNTSQVNVTISEAPACPYPAWESASVYTGGMEVAHNGKSYRAKWWTQGDEPGTTGQYGVWEETGDCGTTNIAPVISNVSPANNATLNDLNVNFSADATDSDGTISSVVFEVNNQSLNGSNGSGNTYTATWTALSYGSYTLTVKATDNDGAVTVNSVSFQIEDNSCQNGCPPQVSITSPSNGSEITQSQLSSITLSGSVNGNASPAVSNVVFIVDNQTINGTSQNGTDYTASWIPSDFGNYTIVFEVSDANSTYTVTDQVSVTVSQQVVNPSGIKVVGYFPSWSGSENDIQYSKLTHINYSFALPTAAGGLEPIDNPTKLQNLVTLAHNNNVKVLIAVGGWNIGDGGGNDSRFDQLASNAATRTTFVNNVMAFVAQYNLDGVDMDWEYPDPNTASQTDFTLLMDELSTALHAQGKLLTAAVVAQGWTGGGVEDAVFADVDFLNIMAYDGGNGADHSPYSYAESSLNYWLGRGLPKEKAILGVPFYARPSWKSYKTLLSEGADPNADQFGSDYYNGISTIQAKTVLGSSQGGGIMIWEISQDTNDSNSLLSAIHDALTPACNSGCDPVVNISSPANGSDIQQSTFETVTLSATASDADGTVSSVVFTINGQNINASGNGGVYSASWTPTAYGNYNLTATATDNEGRTSTSSSSFSISDTPVCNTPEWDANTVYAAPGIEVLYQGNIYRNKWWTQGNVPGAEQWGPWELVGPCGSNARTKGLNASNSHSVNISDIVAYPNPFKDSTTLHFNVVNKNRTIIRLYNLNGQIIETVSNRILEKGTYRMELKTQGLNSGIYFYKILIGNEIKTLKVIKN